VLCVLHTKEKRQSQDNQNIKVVQMKYRGKKNPAGGMDVCVVCYQVEVSARRRSLVQRSPTDCGCVSVRDHMKE
jgi:hypothetical protein